MADQGADATPAQALIRVIEIVEALQEASANARSWTEATSCGRVGPTIRGGCCHPECIVRAGCYAKDFTMEAVQLVNELEAALAVSPQGWESIETAPKDERVLVVLTSGEIAFVYYVQGVWTYDDSGAACVPAFWYPLPSPPRVAAGPEEK